MSEFDAELGEDESQQVAASFGTLVEALTGLIGAAAFERTEREDRLAQINLLLAGVSEYGVDATSLVRWGMSRQAWQPILILLIVTPEERRHGEDAPLDFDGWFRALGLSPAETGEIPKVDVDDAGNLLGPTVERALTLLPRWVQLAPLQEILTLSPPAPALFEQIEPNGPGLDVRQAYEWLVERSSEEDLSRWSFSSLQNEFKWREETWLPPFVSGVIETDRATDDALRYALATQAAALPPHLNLGSEERLLEDMKRQALEFLRVHKFQQAAALFEFYNRRDPGNSEALNNLGFCLLPTDPEMALYHWSSLSTRPFHAPAMLAYNQCLGLKLVGRRDEALDQAESSWQRGLGPDEGTAYLWRQVENELELYHEQQVRRALALLAAEIAGEVGRIDRQIRWQERAAAL